MNKEKRSTAKRVSEKDLEKIQKSWYYRDYLAPYLGNCITIDVPSYEVKPYMKNWNLFCFRQAKVVKVGEMPLDEDALIGIEHIWVSVDKNVKVNENKPIRAVGTPYEYAHRCGKRMVKNIGLNVRYLTQD